MRGLRTIWNHILKSPAALIGAFIFVTVGVSGLGLTAQNAGATSNDIVGGGIWNRDLASKCHGDVKTIMDHYRIDCNLAGVVDGRACRDGNVYVGDRVVARDSRSIGRNPIQGNRPISIGGQTYYETHNSQALLSECLDAWVKLDGNGTFIYAIIKACGNPIWTPAPVVVSPPKPQEKYVWVCELSTKQTRYVREESANDSKYSKNLSDCKETTKYLEVCIIVDKKTVKITESEYKNNQSKYTTDFSKCEEKPAPLTVCRLEDKKTVEISEDELKQNGSKYSTDTSKCQETPNPKGEELPQTGIGDNLLSGGLGLGSLIVAGSAYVASRKDWLALLNR